MNLPDKINVVFKIFFVVLLSARLTILCFLQTDTPGPGNYQFSHSDFEKHSTSFSKKGTGGFASKVGEICDNLTSI